jgi:hypothetical protein
MKPQWIVTNPHREPPSEPLPSHPIFETWEQFIGPITPSDDDYEYFVEEAFRLHSAVTSFGAENIWLAEFRGEKLGQAKNLITGEWKTTEELSQGGASTYGAVRGTTRHSGWFSNPVDDYCILEAFKSNAGRVTGIGGFNDKEEEECASSIDDVLIAIKEAGADKALLKRRHAKLPLVPLNLENWEPGVSLISCTEPDEGWSLINDEGVRNAYLVQEVIPMRYEYRFFVIRGKLVTGAGCVEEFTPLDNDGKAFDSRVREYRSEECPSPIEDRRDILDQFLAFAEKVVEELTVECPEFDRYVLDVALGKDDEPVIVEFNSESNAGFYACQPQLITDALAGNLS